MTKSFEGLTFSRMVPDDVAVLTPIMKRAFDDDSRLFFNAPQGGPPGYDDGSFLRKWGLDSGAQSYRVDKDGVPAGAMILFLRPQSASGVLGCLFVDTCFMGHGVALSMWRFAEQSYPSITKWYSETPAVSYRNHRFYINKCGFSVVAVQGGRDRYEAQFKLYKDMNKAR